MVEAAALNADPSIRLDAAALDAALAVQPENFRQALSERHAHLFSTVPVFACTGQMAQMQAVVEAVERVVRLPGWGEPVAGTEPLGVFYGYDFHLNADGAHLIEINTNAGGAFLCAVQSGRQAELEAAFLAMFRKEWWRARGEMPLQAVAIVDEAPAEQYLYPEFLLAQAMFRRAGLAAVIADPAELVLRADGLYCGAQRIDLVYNRLTDFSLTQHPALLTAWQQELTVVTPYPVAYARYADKRNLARLTDADGLRALGASEADIAVLQAGVPQTQAVRPEREAQLWAERKQWFFKPNSGYGSKGAYRGDKLTRRVFGEIVQGDYVAQRLAAPGERSVALADGSVTSLKYDVRCYVYDGAIQLVVARLYQGQTTNFRTPGGGFAPILQAG